MYRNAKLETYRDVRDAYFEGSKTQKEIAKENGISERTLRNWIKEGSWDRQRQNAKIVPVLMLDGFCSQLIWIQNTIANRPPEDRMPKPEEVEMQRKLINNIIRMENYPTDKFRSLAYGINTVSDLDFAKEEESPEENSNIDLNAPLSSRYIPFQAQLTANEIAAPAFFSDVAKQTQEEVQVFDNELIDKNEGVHNGANTGKKAAKRGILKPVSEQHKTPKYLENSESEELPYQRKKDILLQSGVRWLEKGEVFDPSIQHNRTLTMDEWDELIGLGLTAKDFDGWCPALAL